MDYVEIEKDTYQRIWGELKGEFTKNDVSFFYINPSETIIDFITFLKERNVSGSVLDVGCGNARHAVAFAKRGYDAYGIDFSTKALELAKKHVILRKVSIDLKKGSVFDLPYSSNFFDVIIDSGCLHHLRKSQWEEYRENILRVLKDKGYYYLYCFSINIPYIPGQRRPKKRNWSLRRLHYCHYFTYKEVQDFFGKHLSILKRYEWTKDDYPERFKVFYMKKNSET
ncbi:MAG: class I SAM-dependent methyltransferase [Deltaproteobacteria bacterium]|nr:class I SAM-dependent methyltransferase [Deltaproteobacteria bacterium]